jgi:hypothetical protein
MLYPVDCVHRICILRTVFIYYIYMRTKMACVVQVSGLGMACVVEFLCKQCRGCTRRVFGVLVGTGSYISSFGDLLWFWMSLLDCGGLVTLHWWGVLVIASCWPEVLGCVGVVFSCLVYVHLWWVELFYLSLCQVFIHKVLIFVRTYTSHIVCVCVWCY